MPNNNPHQTVEKILCSWSRTLELEQLSGESIVTESDLNRVTRVLSEYIETARFNNLSTQLLHDSNTQ